MGEDQPTITADTAGDADATKRLSGQLLSGRYQVRECLGEGAMGAVYRAEHTLMKKTVALKVMRPQIGERDELVERFRREAQAAANIEHPNVCSASDFGETDDGMLFLVMEYLEGRTLEEAIEEQGRLGVERTVRLALQACAALSRAHELGVVHRDLKPENIMLVERDDDEDFVKILDFGVAHVRLTDDHQEEQLTKAGTVWGTPAYMSPEQATGTEIDGRSDLYSLGVILYEMLTGQPPFADDNPARVMAMHLTEVPRPPSKLAPQAHIPPGLDKLVMQLLEKAPEDRPASAEELAGLLAEYTAAPVGSKLLGKKLVGEKLTGEKLTDLSREISGRGIEQLREAWSSAAPALERARAWFEAQSMGVQGVVAGIAAALFFGVLAAPPIVLYAVFSGPPSDEVRQEAARDLAAERQAYLEEAGLSHLVADLEGGRTTGVLETLDKLDEPEASNPHVAYLGGWVNGARGRWQAAVEHYGAALQAEPLYANDAQLIDHVFERFSDHSDKRAAAARELIEEHLDSRYALDKLADAAQFAGRKALRQRAYDVLESTGRIGDLEDWQLLGIELRHTDDCDERAEIIEKIVDEGDPRALDIIEYFAKRGKTGCGFLKMQDCYDCIRSDLRDARKILEAERD
ncbi:MAG: serine/threonine-protein kinase [Persicimonas sp.]